MTKIQPGSLSAVYLKGSKHKFSFTVENDKDQPAKGTPFFHIKTHTKQQVYVVYDPVTLAPHEKRTFEFEVKLDLPVGEATASFCFEEESTNCVEKPIYIASEGPPIYVSFVWHHHQAPQFYPDGKLKDEWAFIHVAKGGFYSYEGGPYKVHMLLHKKQPGFIDVDHFSPSLLEQWQLFLEGKLDSKAASREDIKALLDSIREGVSQGKIEPLGSVYAHTVQGLLFRKAKQYGLEDFLRKLLSWEITVGLGIVEKVLGTRPRGMWTPEMFWHMELVGLYSSLGIDYTVLCEQHFIKSGGDKEDIYQPYLVRDSYTGSQIVVFFRDLALSNWVSFHVDFRDPEDADNAARRFVIELAKRREQHPGGIVVIALDGENWMIMPNYRKYAPFFLERIVEYMGQSNILVPTTLSGYLAKNPPKRTLNYLPTGSWIELTDRQWTGGVKDELWKEAMETMLLAEAAYQLLGKDSEKMLKDPSSPLYSLFKALAIGLDSDFYWYGDDKREQEFIKAWLAEARKIAKSILETVEVKISERTNSHVFLELTNRNQATATLSVAVQAEGYSSQIHVSVAPNASSRIPVYVSSDSATIRVSAGKVTITELKLAKTK
jgi:hypothetical protein